MEPKCLILDEDKEEEDEDEHFKEKKRSVILDLRAFFFSEKGWTRCFVSEKSVTEEISFLISVRNCPVVFGCQFVKESSPHPWTPEWSYKKEQNSGYFVKFPLKVKNYQIRCSLFDSFEVIPGQIETTTFFVIKMKLNQRRTCSLIHAEKFLSKIGKVSKVPIFYINHMNSNKACM